MSGFRLKTYQELGAGVLSQKTVFTHKTGVGLCSVHLVRKPVFKNNKIS